MIEIKAQVEGVERVARELEKIPEGIEDKLRAVIARSAKNIENKAKVLGSKGSPPASAPGSPPGRRSGRLIGSLRITFTNGGMQASIGPDTPYAKFLAGGTRKMAPRPLMPPALRAEEDHFVASILNCIKGI